MPDVIIPNHYDSGGLTQYLEKRLAIRQLTEFMGEYDDKNSKGQV